MASKRKESEGIALLSMYNDDEDMDVDDEDDKDDDDDDDTRFNVEADKGGGEDGEFKTDRNEGNVPMIEDDGVPSEPPHEASPYLRRSQTPLLDSDRTLKSPNSTTPQPPLSSSLSPLPPLPRRSDSASDVQRLIRGSLGIVDYAHDETAVSPDAEWVTELLYTWDYGIKEGEIVSTGNVMLGEERQFVNGDFQGRTPPGTVQILTPTIQGTPPVSSDQLDYSNYESTAINNTTSGSEAAEADIDATPDNKCVEESIHPLDKFLPPPPNAKCSEELQRKINKFLELKKKGISFNADLRNRKDYRNPDFLLHAVSYQDIDQIGTCFSKDVFDPYGYDKSDYYDEIEADMKREMERKEQEKKKNQKVDFVSGGTQPGAVVPAPKINTQIPGSVGGFSAVAAAGSHAVQAAVDAVVRESRQNKKSKWDKVDSDRRNPLHSGGQDTLSAAGAHAALLSAANAGAGYTAFAQQKRREAEERRSSDRKLEKRS